jgi:hypothetical protein
LRWNSADMANSITGKDCMVSLFCILAVFEALLSAHLLILQLEIDLRMDFAACCICSCGLEDIYPSACAEAKVEVV